MIRKKLKCEYDYCSWEGYVRTICKNKNSNYHRKALCPKHATYEKEKTSSKKRSVYFDYHINRCNRSEEDGSYIAEPWRGNICHIVDKGRHPSVEDELNNYVYLTLDQHTAFDNYLFKHDWESLENKFPNSWKKAKERLLLFEDKIEENTKFKRDLIDYVREQRNTEQP